MFDGIKTFEMISSIPVDAYSPPKINKGECIRVYRVCKTRKAPNFKKETSY